MKALARSTLFRAAPLVLASVALFHVPANAQQEVAPERFDAQPARQGQKPGAPANQKAHAKAGPSAASRRAAPS